MFKLSDGERDRRWNLVRSEMEKRNLDCLIIWGSFGCYRDANANLQYMTNVNTEGYLIFPLEGEPTQYSFENGLDPAWVTDWRGAIPHFGQNMTPRLKELGIKQVGLVGLSGLYGELSGFASTTHRVLEENFADASFDDATDIIEEARKIKSEEEIECLMIGCRFMETLFGKIAATAGVGVEDWEVRAMIMETLFANDFDPGAMILYRQGPNVMHGGESGGWLEPANHKKLESGDIILIELDATYLGYKAQFNHAWSVGEPDEEWQGIFACAAEAYGKGLDALRPGLTVGELEDVLLEPLRTQGYKWGNPPFHGLGLGLEAPMGDYPRVGYSGAPRDEKIEENMVIEFEPHPANADLSRAASVGGPILVTADGCQQMAEWWTPDPILVTGPA